MNDDHDVTARELMRSKEPEDVNEARDFVEACAVLQAENERLRKLNDDNIRTMLAEIERLREFLKGPDPHYDLARANGELRAENARLRAQLVSDINAETEIDRLETENERLRASMRVIIMLDQSIDDARNIARRALEGGK